MARRTALLLGLALLGALVPTGGEEQAARAEGRFEGGPDDVVVMAVVDFNFSPYHWDFLASKMPQHLDSDPDNDLPLDRPPHTWLPGFPDPKDAFKSYNRFDLSLEERDESAVIAGLDAKDAPKWAKVQPSTYDSVNYYWFPDTKFIGAVEFGSEQLHGTTSDHGVGVSSVSVGNLHGTCPECLMVFINIDSAGDEASALRWAMAQPWIDVVSNSYGRGYAKVYNGPGVEEGKRASQRGQTVFFSAGNGIENAYTVTNNTYYSSEKGPDWIVTVGAVSPGENNHYGGGGSSTNASYVGAGKPVDVAGVGLSYPSAYGSAFVGQTGGSGFSGTSNASPTVAGTYARALYIARKDLIGPSRVQRNSVIAKGARYDCGSARRRCELRDGILTAMELRKRLLHGAVHTPAGMTTYAGGELPPIGEDEFLNEGHGTYFARESGKLKPWLKEFERIVAPLEGRSRTLERPDGEREWMIVDSWCRQNLWGAWAFGYYKVDKTGLPDADPAWPIRTSLLESCEFIPPPP